MEIFEKGFPDTKAVDEVADNTYIDKNLWTCVNFDKRNDAYQIKIFIEHENHNKMYAHQHKEW